MERLVGNTRITLVQGDITKQQVDTMVNAANSRLAGGGGVDGAIHRAGGPSIMEECRAIGGCPTGQAVRTTAGDLPAKHVIHTVGPVWNGGASGEADLLASAYRNSLRVAAEHAARSIAFPAISTGVYGYPIDLAAAAALGTVLAEAPGYQFDEIRFVLFSAGDLAVYEAALERPAPSAS